MTSTAVQIFVEIRQWGASEQISEILTIFRFYLYRGFTQGCAYRCVNIV